MLTISIFCKILKNIEKLYVIFYFFSISFFLFLVSYFHVRFNWYQFPDIKELHNDEKSSLGYFSQLDGIPCPKSEWVENAESDPILSTNQGKVKGSHRCKYNRRYSNPEILDGRGPKRFEGDSFYNVPYAKHVRRYDYGTSCKFCFQMF